MHRSNRRSWNLCVLCLLLLSGVSQAVDDVAHLVEAGAQIGKEVADHIGEADAEHNNGALNMLVGTFRFGDQQGQVSSKLGIAPTQLQSHMIEGLVKSLNENGLRAQYNALDIDELDATTGGLIAIDVTDPASTRVKAAQKGISVSVIGTFEEDADGNYLVSAFVITPWDVSLRIERRVRRDGVIDTTQQGGGGFLTGRFSLEVYAKAANETQFLPIPLKEDKTRSDDSRKVLYLVIKREKYFGQPFEIHLKNLQDESL